MDVCSPDGQNAIFKMILIAKKTIYFCYFKLDFHNISLSYFKKVSLKHSEN